MDGPGLPAAATPKGETFLIVLDSRNQGTLPRQQLDQEFIISLSLQKNGIFL